ERNVLDNLTATDEDLAEEVRRMLFVFEDIVKLEERAIQQVLREADQKDLVLALRGAPESVKEVVLANVSERGAQMIKEEMEIQQPQRKRDIDEAQGRIVAVVRRLQEAGTIVLPGEEGEESEVVI
ncbi:MAG TPA: FliG C-terminal domain-containing protein, partial [Solirubrobacteraceae bacterium]|nr:FliG C-terminal domain-containing protein [Solirubrobacteraceae bacterium]